MPRGPGDARQIRSPVETTAQSVPDSQALARDPDANRRATSAVRRSCPTPAALRVRFPERALAWPSGRVVPWLWPQFQPEDSTSRAGYHAAGASAYALFCVLCKAQPLGISVVERFTPERSAPLRSVSRRMATPRSAPANLAPFTLAPRILTLRNCAL